MISDKEKIYHLHKNECPKCKRKYMFSDTENNKYYVVCGFCSNAWEITKETMEEHVRIMDTWTYKRKKGLV